MGKAKELRQMEFERFNDLKFATDNWDKFSVKEKLEFVQKSFDQINAYVSKKEGLNPNDVKFGFSKGIKIAGGFSYKSNCILVPFCLCAYFSSPKEIDLMLRHEFGHRIQKAHNIKLSKNYDISRMQPLYFHRSTPIEEDADNRSYMGFLRSSFTGLLKSDLKVYAAKECFTGLVEWMQNSDEHQRGKIAYLTRGKIGLNKAERESLKNYNGESRISKNGIWYLSLGQIERLIDRYPQQFESFEKYSTRNGNSGAEKLDEYIEMTRSFHNASSFFGKFENGERNCYSVHKKTKAHGHRFDRYDRQGNLIDEDDIDHQYVSYVPQEVQDARELNLYQDPDDKASEKFVYEIRLKIKEIEDCISDDESQESKVAHIVNDIIKNRDKVDEDKQNEELLRSVHGLISDSAKSFENGNGYQDFNIKKSQVDKNCNCSEYFNGQIQ